MLQLLTLTPFGFVLQLGEDGDYFTPKPYTLFLNGKARHSGNELVANVFGLTPDTEYLVEVKGLGEPLCMTVRTQHCGFAINVRGYNAAGDGTRSDTAAILAAIYSAPPGSVVVIPPGEYLVEQIFLKSDVDLYLQKGAVLRQNPDRDTLAILKGYQKNRDFSAATINASWEGNPLDCFCSLIYGKGAERVRIYGEGILDGSGKEGGWWKNPKQKNRAYRPRNLSLVDCSNITVCGLTSRNSAAWNIHPFYSRHLNFYGLRIESDPHSPNTDGLDPESCENVQITGCRFQVGDDCIAIKSGKLFMGRRHFQPSREISISHCLMEEGHGGVVIGSEISCGVRQVRIENCLFRRTDRGLRIKTRRGRGDTSVVEDIVLSRVRMQQVGHCLSVNMYYNCDPDGHSDYVRCKTALPADSETPAVRGITLSQVTATDICGSAVFLYGLPESKIHGVTIRDCRFTFSAERRTECPDMLDDPVVIPNLGIFAKNVRGLHLANSPLIGTHTDVLEETEELL